MKLIVFVSIMVLLALASPAFAFQVQIPGHTYLAYDVEDTDEYIQADSVVIADNTRLSSQVTVCISQRSPAATTTIYKSTPVRIDGIQYTTLNLKDNLKQCFSFFPLIDSLKKPKLTMTIGFSTITLIFSSQYSTAAYSATPFDCGTRNPSLGTIANYSEDTEDAVTTSCATSMANSYDEDWSTSTSIAPAAGAMTCSYVENYTWRDDFSNAGAKYFEYYFTSGGIAGEFQHNFTSTCYDWTTSTWLLLNTTFNDVAATQSYRFNITIPSNCFSQNNPLRINVTLNDTTIGATAGRGSISWYEDRLLYNKTKSSPTGVRNCTAFGVANGVYVYNLSGSKVWDYPVAAAAIIRAVEPYNLSEGEFLMAVNSVGTTNSKVAGGTVMIFDINGQLNATTADLGTAADGVLWDMDSTGNSKQAIAVLYDSGAARQMVVAGYWNNLTLKNKVTLTTGAVSGISGAFAAHMVKANDTGRYSSLFIHAGDQIPAAPGTYNKFFRVNSSVNSTCSYTSATGQSAATSIGRYTNTTADEMLICGQQGTPKCEVLNSTCAVRLTFPFLVAVSGWLPSGYFTGATTTSVVLENTTATGLNMTNQTYKTVWSNRIASQAPTTASAVADFNGDGRDDFCLNVNATYIYCYSNASGERIGEFTVTTGISGIWGHQPLNYMDNMTAGYLGALLLATDTSGKVYVYNFTNPIPAAAPATATATLLYGLLISGTLIV